MSIRDAEVRARAVQQVREDPRLDICPDCDGTGRGYTDNWPYDKTMVTCRRCRGDAVVRRRTDEETP